MLDKLIVIASLLIVGAMPQGQNPQNHAYGCTEKGAAQVWCVSFRAAAQDYNRAFPIDEAEIYLRDDKSCHPADLLARVSETSLPWGEGRWETSSQDELEQEAMYAYARRHGFIDPRLLAAYAPPFKAKPFAYYHDDRRRTKSEKAYLVVDDATGKVAFARARNFCQLPTRLPW